MPRPGPDRAVTHESNLAARIAHERERREWTYESLARHMARHGCPVPASALYKIEKGNPPRRINVDEFMTLARVFDVEPMQLLRHPAEIGDRRLATLIEELQEADEQARPAFELIESKLASALQEVERRPETAVVILPTLEDLAARADRRRFNRLHDWVSRQRWTLAANPDDATQANDVHDPNREG